MPEITPDQITAGLAAAEGGSPAAPPAAPPAAAPQEGSAPQPPASSGAAPWAKDLEGLGLAPDGLAAVDKYLRDQWQPRMTEFETKNKGYMDLFGGSDESMQTAASMFKAFQENPEDAFVQLGLAMGYIDEADLGEDPQGALDEQLGQPEQPQTALPPEYQQWMDEKMAAEREEKEMQKLNDYFDTVAKQFEGQDFDRDLYHMLFVGAMGNEDAALEKYRTYASALAAGQAPATPPAPPVLNDATGNTPVAGGPKPKTIDEAMNAFMEMDRAAKRG